MEIHADVIEGPAKPASTVVMLRDCDGGGGARLEVFLVKRHGLSDVLGGAYVFPGGKVDTQDARLDMATHLDQTPQMLHARLGEPALDALDAAALYVAAMREAFEETGVLYAAGVGEPEAARAACLLRDALTFDEVLEEMQLRLLAGSLVPWSRWITPLSGGVLRKRFDTRFFVATVPAGQVAKHDNHEATDSVWITPREALRQYWEGAIELAPPQIMSLAHLARHSSAQSVIADAAGTLPPLIQPEAVEQDGVRVLCYPGDPRHPVRERALPGPSCLHYRNRRFEPSGGFEALFD
ncbi:MAG: NUDIX hydrolase [Haliea sp.]|nr:MAG: NUDIX hydrolase [Haliea sp.]